jgi:GMP reductase
MRIEDDIKLDYSDVLLRPKRSTLGSRKEVNLVKEYTFRNSGGHYVGVPIMAANMDTTGTFEVAKVMADHHMFTCLHKHYGKADWSNTYDRQSIAVSSGILKEDIEKLSFTLNDMSDIEYICLDVANGYSEKFSQVIRNVRKEFPKHTIIAGNVVTADMTMELILAGADIVKVGIGPGSVCTTRIKTGVGYPQLSAVIECADAAHGLGGHIIADGGCTCPGDIAKAFGAGADFVMLGGMLAGHNETGSEFYGMSSDTAMKKYNGGVADYRSSEGKTVVVPPKGPLSNTLKDIMGGVRSACTYVGARSLKDLPKCTTFIRVNNQHNKVFG